MSSYRLLVHPLLIDFAGGLLVVVVVLVIVVVTRGKQSQLLVPRLNSGLRTGG